MGDHGDAPANEFLGRSLASAAHQNPSSPSPSAPSWARPVSSVRVMRRPILTWSSTGPPASDSSKLVRVNLVSSTSTTSLPSAKPGCRWSGNTDVAHAPAYDCMPICSQLDTRERLITPPSLEVRQPEPRTGSKLVPPLIQATRPSTTTFDGRFTLVLRRTLPLPVDSTGSPTFEHLSKPAIRCSTATTATPAPDPSSFLACRRRTRLVPRRRRSVAASGAAGGPGNHRRGHIVNAVQGRVRCDQSTNI